MARSIVYIRDCVIKTICITSPVSVAGDELASVIVNLQNRNALLLSTATSENAYINVKERCGQLRIERVVTICESYFSQISIWHQNMIYELRRNANNASTINFYSLPSYVIYILSHKRCINFTYKHTYMLHVCV